MKYLKPTPLLSQNEINKMTAIHYLSSNLTIVNAAIQQLPFNDYDVETIDRLTEEVILFMTNLNNIIYERNKEAEDAADTSNDCRSAH